MITTTDSLIYDYARRYSARDADGVTELCLSPFVAIREGAVIHLADRDAVRDHFAQRIDVYRAAGSRHADYVSPFASPISRTAGPKGLARV